MPDLFTPYLCGGVLYFLLAQTKISRSSSRDHRDGIKDDHSDPIMMGDLIYTFTGDKYSITARKDISLYRECQSEGSVNVPFNDASFASGYDSTVTARYPEALRRMCEFVSWHIHPQKYEWLIKALLDIIEHDESISDTDPFYINSDGTPATKAMLRRMDSFLIQPFLVGVLHFILTCRMGCNHLGIATLDEWGTKANHRERQYIGNAGDGIQRIIQVGLYEFPKEEKTDPLAPPDSGSEVISENEQKNNAPQEEPEEHEDEYIESEIVNDDDDPSGNTGSNPSGTANTQTTIIQHQTNVIQNGENNYQFTNNGTMVFDFRKGK